MAHAPLPTLGNRGKLDWPSLPLGKASDDTEFPVTGVGQELRNERERRGEQLNDVWLAVKIRRDHLAAIEEGRFEDLPGRGFTIGYVGRYARYLRLDVKKIVDRLEAEMASREGANDHPLAIVPLPNRKLRLGAMVIGGLLVAALTYSGDDIVAFASRAYEQATDEGLAQKAGSAPALAPIKQRTPVAALERPIPQPTETAVTPAVSLPAEAAPSLQAPLPPGRQYGLQNRVSRIILRVHRPTLVQVRGVRNKDFIDRTLAPGDTYRVPNVGGLTLTVDDGGAVEIVLDGVSAGFVGTQGVAARDLSLAPQSIINRQKRG